MGKLSVKGEENMLGHPLASISLLLICVGTYIDFVNVTASSSESEQPTWKCLSSCPPPVTGGNSSVFCLNFIPEVLCERRNETTLTEDEPSLLHLRTVCS